MKLGELIKLNKNFRFKHKITLVSMMLVFFYSNAQVSFSEGAITHGIDLSYNGSTFGGGVSFVDFDNDGWDDISITSESGEDLYFYKNNNGTFTRVTFTGISSTDESKQITWVDYDNDGDKDLFVTNIVGVNKFYRNDGNMMFTDISTSIGFFQDDLFTYGASFGDIDNDGDLDAFISNRDGISESQRNYLYRNDNGVFVDITQTAGISMANHLSFCSIFFDYDNDGDQDIYISNDKPIYKNLLYRNNGDGTFTDVSDASGAGIEINAMSTTIGDYNNDGWFDIYVTNTPQGNALLKNNGDGTFTDVADATGTIFDSVGWGAVFLDADNDALLDLYVSGNFDENMPSFLSAAFYHQGSNETFTIPSNIGFDNDLSISYCNAIGDINNDGKPEIVVTNDTDKHNLWENTSSNSNNWLKVKLEGTVSNKDGIGNKIEIRANGISQYRYTLAGEGYLSQNSNYEFFGIADATSIEYIKVTWNTTGQVETINNVQPNQSLTIVEGNGILSTSSQNTSDLSIYPNPSDAGIYKINSSISSEIEAKIYTIQGKLVLNQLIEDKTIDLSSLSSGVYMVKLNSGQQSIVKKLIKN